MDILWINFMKYLEILRMNNRLKGEINLSIAKRKGLTAIQIENIRTLHKESDRIIDYLSLAKDKESKEFIDKIKRWEDIQFVLQDIWGFPQVAIRHKSYFLPGCSCAKMDNEDWYPYQRSYMLDCPVCCHLTGFPKKEK